MVKKKGVIWDFFNVKGKGVACKYCSHEYKQANSIKMENHIKKCIKCPAGLKHILSKGKPRPSTTGFVSQPLTVEVDCNDGQSTLVQTSPRQAVSTSVGLSSVSPFKSPTPTPPKILTSPQSP